VMLRLQLCRKMMRCTLVPQELAVYLTCCMWLSCNSYMACQQKITK
jgi:hypothetical protein